MLVSKGYTTVLIAFAELLAQKAKILLIIKSRVLILNR
jgi:hypothetical protein